eukprot:scaffold12518_cov75-Cyclotella_meneghiniana.AAC.4
MIPQIYQRKPMNIGEQSGGSVAVWPPVWAGVAAEVPNLFQLGQRPKGKIMKKSVGNLYQ